MDLFSMTPLDALNRLAVLQQRLCRNNNSCSRESAGTQFENKQKATPFRSAAFFMSTITCET